MIFGHLWRVLNTWGFHVIHTKRGRAGGHLVDYFSVQPRNLYPCNSVRFPSWNIQFHVPYSTLMIHKFNLSSCHLVELLYEFVTQVVLLGKVWYRHFQLLFIWYSCRFKCLIPKMTTNTLFGPILWSMLIVIQNNIAAHLKAYDITENRSSGAVHQESPKSSCSYFHLV